MSFSTIMVHFDLENSTVASPRVAASLAEMFDARLIGIAATDFQPLYFLEGPAAEKFLEEERNNLLQKIAAEERKFREMFKHRANKIEWRSMLAWLPSYTAQELRAADLLILESAQTERGGLKLSAIGEIILRAGRPVLLVPPALEWMKLNHMLVAWKDTREARRAVNDALPLLHKAKEVVVVELAENDSDLHSAKSRIEDVAAWLIRRGINAATIATKALIGVADQIAIIAQDEGADLIIAGAYGHTRFNEWVFGGVTRSLLQQQKCCVLLSH